MAEQTGDICKKAFKYGKVVHVFSAKNDPTKLLLTIGRFEDINSPVIAGIELDSAKTKRLIQMLMARLKQIEKAEIAGKEKNDD